MVSFLDGPASGETLMLRRVPMLLRVVQSRDGEWDALDQLDDVPKATETIHVYRRRDDLGVGWMHLCARGRSRAASGRYYNCSYSVVPNQPSDEQVRTTEAWQAWATAWLAAAGKQDAQPG